MSRTFVGEGTLSTAETLGGKGVLFPVGAGSSVVIALAVFYATRPGATASAWGSVAAAAIVPLWLAWRTGMLRALASVLRGTPRPSFRVELDELVIRTSTAGGPASTFDWFEVERFDVSELGLVLWLRVPKNGANAILAPRSFFEPSEWEPLVALVREKLPGAAKANDERAAAIRPTPRSRGRALLLWALLVALLYSVYQLLAEPGR